MIARPELQQLSPAARADLIHRAALTEVSDRLWRAALGTPPPPAEPTAAAGPARRLDIDALVRTLMDPSGAGEPQVAAVIPEVAKPESDTGPLKLGVNAAFQGSIEAAARRTGVPAEALAAVIDAEAAKGRDGRWNSLSRNPRSSAAGLGQFLSGTWEDMAERRGTWLNGVANAQGWLDPSGRLRAEFRAELLKLRYDPNASIQTTADFARTNLQRLKRAGVMVGEDGSDIARIAYMAHHLGAGDAISFLRGQLTDDRAARLLAAQVGKTAAADRIAATGQDASAAHRHWLQNYVDRRIRPERFLA